jgi:hypothetical protein
MKKLTITAPDAIFDQTVNSLAYMGGWADVIDDPENEANKLAFAKERLIVLLGDQNREYAARQIRQAGQAQIQATVETVFGQIAATYPEIQVTIE